MVLKCLGSNSSGNCYLLENDNECLVIEAGIPFKEVKKSLGFNISKIQGLLITHEHGDHAAYARDYEKSGIPIFTSHGTAENAGLILANDIKCGYWYTAGGFRITPFHVVHDAADPFGYIINHPDIGDLLFATDTEYIKSNFKKLQLNHILIECNYSLKIADGHVYEGVLPESLRNRIIKSHMSLETCKEFIRQNVTSRLENVVLLHLSDSNSNEKYFIEEIEKVTGEFVDVFAADKGFELRLDILPF